MITAEIHLKTKESFQLRQDHLESKEVIDKFIESFLNLDISILEPYISEEDVFENLDKYRFLAMINTTFKKYREVSHGNFKVINNTTTCQFCSFGKRVEHFEIYNTQTKKLIYEVGMLIDEQDGILVDIFHCNFLKPRAC